jgi:hypothetical protein
MVIQPVCRHGLEIEALEKQTFCAPSAARSEVFFISPSMYCSQGCSGSPSKLAERCSDCRSYTSWTNHSSPLSSAGVGPPAAALSLAVGFSIDESVVQAVSASSAVAATTVAFE